MARLLLAWSLVLMVAAVALGQPAPSSARPTTSQVADSVVAAVEAGGDPAAALPESGVPDAWQVADELLRRERRAEAAALAEAVTGPGVAALAKHVSEPGVGKDQTAAYTARDQLIAALRGGDFEAAVGVEPTFTEPLSVVEIDLAFGRGVALGQLKRHAEAVAFLSAAGERAEAIGWLVRAREAFRRAGAYGYGQIEAPRVVEVTGRAIALSARLGDALSVAKLSLQLGHAIAMSGDAAGSGEAYARAQATFRELGDERGVAVASSMVATACLEQGLIDEAREGFGEAIGLQRRLGDRESLTISLSNLGLLELEAGRPRRSIELFAECIEVDRALGNRRGEAISRLNLGLAQMAVGDVEAGVGSYRSALQQFEASGDRYGAAKVRMALARTLRRRAEYDASLELLEHARAELVAIGALVDADSAVHQVGLVYLARGGLPEALSAFEEALASARSAGRASEVSSVLNSIGTAYAQLGDDARAVAAFTEAWEAAGEIGTRINLGNQLIPMGRLDEAEEHFQAVLGVAVESGQRRLERICRMSIGRLRTDRGDHEAALTAYREALENADATDALEDAVLALVRITEAETRIGRLAAAETAAARAAALLAEDPSPPLEVQLAMVGARLRLAEGQAAEAAAEALRGVELLPTLSSGLAEGEGAGLREAHADLFGVGLAAALRLDDVELALRFVEHSRAGSLREALGSRAALEAAVVPIELRRELNDAHAGAEAALNVLRRVKKLKERREARDAYDAARTRVRDAVARIEREVKAAAGVSAGVIDDLGTIQSRLAAGRTAVFYGEAAGSLCAIVVTRAEARIVDLGPTSAVDTAVAALQLQDRTVDPADAIAGLRALVIEPLKLPVEAKRVLVSPVAGLAYVPFALLLEDRVVVNVPSGTVHGLLAEREAVGGTDVLAFGDPDYGTHAGAGRRLMSLPGTRAEVEAIGTVTHLGSEATEAGFHVALAERSRWRAVHLACHGLVDPERPLRSALALSPTAADDGQLTCFELFGTDIDADLVVLSACQTGKGRVYRAEGIVGLTGAFLHAGARGVVCSLWDVDDAATSALMTKFYELWNAEPGQAADNPPLTAAEALRAAQAHVRAQDAWSHPAFWAPWVIWGGDR